MTSSATLKDLGVDRHGSKWRVRIVFPGFGRFTQTGIPTEEAAVLRALELRALRDAGEPPPTARTGTLGQAAEALLARKRVTGKRRPLTADGLTYWRRSLSPWLDGPLSSTLLSRLRRDELEDAILARASVSPTSARNERQALLAALEYAAARGARFDFGILRIPPVPVQPNRRRRALTVAELESFVDHVPSYARRLVLAQATIGNRVGELFKTRPEHVDLEAATLFVPAANCKEHRDKVVPLTAEELTLLREQLGGLHVAGATPTAGCPTMPPGSERLFTSKTGTPWRHTQFDRFVWTKACRRAAAAWRLEHELGPREATPFEWYVEPGSELDGRRRDDDGRRTITTHDLRSTAVTFMRDAGVSREDAAARIGHADAGELLDDVYDRGDRAARVGRALAVAAPLGLRAALSEPDTRYASSHTATSGSDSESRS